MKSSTLKPYFFRCPIASDESAAWLSLGWRRIPVTMIDSSIDGFTFTVPGSGVRYVRYDRRWTLTTRDEKWVVHGEWMYHSLDGDAQLGVRRIEDLSIPPDTTVRCFLPWRRSGQGYDFSGMAFGGVLLLVAAILSLPGIGDALGTAPVIRSVIHASINAVDRSVMQFLRS